MVALASLVLFPGLQDPETGYVRVMIAYLPASLRGLDAGGIRGGVHVHHRHAVELGRELHRERLLPALSA